VDSPPLSNIKKVILFNTYLINAVGSRTTKGVQVMKTKAGSSMLKVKRLDQTILSEPEYYRKSEGLNAVGFYLKPGDEV
jgi:DNA gyrase subunit A